MTTATEQSGIQRALILPGGGLRLSYAAGVMDELFKHGLTFSHMDGTSGGSLNLAMLLSGLTSIVKSASAGAVLKMRTPFPLCLLAITSGPLVLSRPAPAKRFGVRSIRSSVSILKKSALPLVLQPVLICVICQ